VALTPEKPVLIGVLRFIDGSPFEPGTVDVKLLVRGTGPFNSAEKRHDMGSYEGD